MDCGLLDCDCCYEFGYVELVCGCRCRGMGVVGLVCVGCG